MEYWLTKLNKPFLINRILSNPSFHHSSIPAFQHSNLTIGAKTPDDYKVMHFGENKMGML
jgi:hypothetical protein